MSSKTLTQMIGEINTSSTVARVYACFLGACMYACMFACVDFGSCCWQFESTQPRMSVSPVVVAKASSMLARGARATVLRADGVYCQPFKLIV